MANQQTMFYAILLKNCSFASDIGREVRRRVEELSGVERCTVVIQDHFIAEEIARQVNEEPVAAAWL